MSTIGEAVSPSAKKIINQISNKPYGHAMKKCNGIKTHNKYDDTTSLLESQKHMSYIQHKQCKESVEHLWNSKFTFITENCSKLELTFVTFSEIKLVKYDNAILVQRLNQNWLK